MQLCNEGFFRCRCALPLRHEPTDTHACIPECGGSWRADPTHPYGVEILSFPCGTPVTTAYFPDAGNPYATQANTPPPKPRPTTYYPWKELL